MSKKPGARRGANKTAEAPKTPAISRATAQQLAHFVQRLERLDAEAAERKADRAEVLREAQGLGFDPKALDGIVKKRRKDPNNEKVLENLEDVYLNALALDLGELGRWARERTLAESKVRTQATVATQSATVETVVDAYAVTHGLDDTGAAAARLMEGAGA